MKVVRFLRQLTPYNIGETAGFSDIDADNFVSGKIAEHTDIKPHIAQRSGDLDPPQMNVRDFQDAMASVVEAGRQHRTAQPDRK